MIIEWPERLVPSNDSWTINHNSRAFTSQLTNSQQVAAYSGDYWSVDLTFNALVRGWNNDRELSALVARLRGMFNTVKVPHFTRANNRELGNVTLNVSAQSYAMTIQLAGLTDNFRAGDYITVGDQMFEIVEDSVHIGGVANVTLNKPVRAGIIAGAPVEYKNPYCVMRQANPSHTIRNQAVVSSSTLSLREAF